MPGIDGMQDYQGSDQEGPRQTGIAPVTPVSTDRLRGNRKSWVFTFLSDDSGA